MTELLAMMWKQLTHNTALAFLAVILIAGSNSFVAYESSQSNINLQASTAAMESNTAEMVKISHKTEENSRLIAQNQRDMLNLQKALFDKDWEQDKVIAQIYRDSLNMSMSMRNDRDIEWKRD